MRHKEEKTVPKTGDYSAVLKDVTGNAEINIESNPAYIKAVAERDIYKELYKELLETIKTVRVWNT